MNSEKKLSECRFALFYKCKTYKLLYFILVTTLFIWLIMYIYILFIIIYFIYRNEKNHV